MQYKIQWLYVAYLMTLSVYNFLLDFTFNSWKTKNKYTVMEDYSTARLEEELGMHGYLYNSSQVCDRSSGVFTSPSAGWTNGWFYMYL